MSKNNDKTNSAIDKKEIQLPIKWHVPEDLITRFATNMTVQILENEFKVSFFELKPEIRTKSDAPLPEDIRADCVASVIITADRLQSFMKALQIQLDNYNQNK